MITLYYTSYNYFILNINNLSQYGNIKKYLYSKMYYNTISYRVLNYVVHK